eukprot:scaffold14372_cov77-Phaeocystis_antarctica.AAC.1
MHSSLVGTLASAAKFFADETVHPSVRATHPTLTVATESKLSALTSAQPLYAQFPSSVLVSGT